MSLLTLAVRALRSTRRGVTQSSPAIALRRAIYRRQFAAGLPGRCCGVYPSVEAAALAAPPTKQQGYDNPEMAGMYRERMERVYPADYPVLFWLARILPELDRLFDFGGHVGLQFYSYRRYLTLPQGFRWLVCDVPSVAATGARLAAEQGRSELTFTTRFEDAEGFPLLLAAGSLQYLDHAFLPSTLRAFRQPPHHLIVNKLPVHHRLQFATLQDTGPAYQPYAIFAREPFVAALGAVGYELVDSWENAELSCRIPFHAEHDVAAYSGFYFRRRG